MGMFTDYLVIDLAVMIECLLIVCVELMQSHDHMFNTIQTLVNNIALIPLSICMYSPLTSTMLIILLASLQKQSQVSAAIQAKS